MNMKQLRYVAVLAQYNNFTRAAEELGISQPSLSQYIKKIEKQVGAELFIRAGQDVRLSEAGKTYLQIGKQILDLENEMNNRLVDISRDRRGELTLGIAPYRCTSLMPEVIRRFHRDYPGIKVVLQEQVTSELKESAQHGKLDLCVSTLPIDESKFDYKTVMHEETVLAVPVEMCDNTKGQYEKCRIADFAQLPFISLGEGQIMGRLLVELCEQQGLEPNVTVECLDQVAAHSMVMAGVGAALLPYSLVKAHESPAVRYFLLEETTHDRQIVVFWRKGQYLSGPMQKMIDILTTRNQ